MAEANKTLTKRNVVGDQKALTFELTNLANAETISTELRKIDQVVGTNNTTEDKPFGYSVSGGVITADVSTTTDEYTITVYGK